MLSGLEKDDEGKARKAALERPHYHVAQGLLCGFKVKNHTNYEKA